MDVNGALLPADEGSLIPFATSFSDSLLHSFMKVYLSAMHSLSIEQGSLLSWFL